MRKVSFPFLLFFLAMACKKEIPQNPYYQLFRTHAVTNSASYKHTANWSDSIFNISADHINYIKEMNKIDGFDEIPVPSANFSEIKSRMQSLQKSLHPKINALLNKHLFAVYFCEKLGGTGVSGIVYQENKPVGGFIILDSSMLDKAANDWISAKENSVFSARELDLKIQIEEASDNTKENALRYIFLHEFGHIIGVISGNVPDFRDQYRDFAGLPFFHKSWINENQSVFDDTFFYRKKIRFYSDKKIDLDQHWREIYPQLEKTPFPTLYSSVHPDEFFADSFASFVHITIDNRPWRLKISREGKIIYSSSIRPEKNQEQFEILQSIVR